MESCKPRPTTAMRNCWIGSAICRSKPPCERFREELVTLMVNYLDASPACAGGGASGRNGRE